ncbi:MAG TPA: D-sedoheptulose 7-phosphate isomerase [Pyrinomonadaceae bacterium]|nr:D-sedoheptulose 7-phosphate isomerase [Pyrinomonadaceae bacterium]
MDKTTLLRSSLQEHLETVQALIGSELDKIVQSGQMICDALVAGRKILLCGNGGSAADAQHIAAELVGCYEKQRRSWPAIALTVDTSALTAVSNDLGYEQVFARQLAGLAQSGDILIAISTSGKSKNVLKAAERAREIGCRTIALTGSTSDPLGALCDFTVAVPASRTSRVQEAHITIGHLWCEMVDQIPEQ